MNAVERIAQAGLDAICAGWMTSMDPPYPVLADIERVVDSVRPMIEADLRERLAAAIEAEEPALFGSPEDQYQRGWAQMRGKAARIVRERP